MNDIFSSSRKISDVFSRSGEVHDADLAFIALIESIIREKQIPITTEGMPTTRESFFDVLEEAYGRFLAALVEVKTEDTIADPKTTINTSR